MPSDQVPSGPCSFSEKTQALSCLTVTTLGSSFLFSIYFRLSLLKGKFFGAIEKPLSLKIKCFFKSKTSIAK